MAETQGKVANGELPDAWYAMHSPTIYPRNQGHLRNGERLPGPGSGCQLLEQMHYLVYRRAMEQWRMGKSLDAEFTNLGSWINMHATVREGLDHNIIQTSKFRMSVIPGNLLRG